MIIETENLKKLYRTEEVETTALDGVNIRIDEGEFVSIMGPSGCGKSTLLHVLGLIDNPSGGVYKFLGQDVAVSEKLKHNRPLARELNRDRRRGYKLPAFHGLDQEAAAGHGPSFPSEPGA